MRKIALSLITILILSGCANIEPTPMVQESSIVTQNRWWKSFGDAKLNSLMDEALRNNSSIARAGYRLMSASESLSLQKNYSIPIASGSLNAGESKYLNSGISSESFGTSVKIGYEIDLWGRLANATSIKQWEMMATQQDLEATRLAITGEVAKTYWQQAYINERIKIAKENISKSKEIERLISIRYRAGASSRLDLLSATRTTISQEASLQKLYQEREVAKNSMSLLLDVPPHSKEIYEPRGFASATLPKIGANISSLILENRPDIKAATMRIEKSISGVEYAKSSFYPTFNLTGSLGTSSNALKDIVANPIGSIALGVALPFLNWNENSINLKVSKIEYEDTKVAYKQSMYQALAEIENALYANEKYTLQGKILQKAYSNAKEQERLQAIRYKAGAASLKEWLDAGDVSRNAQLSYIDNLYSQYTNRVSLYLAMGGV